MQVTLHAFNEYFTSSLTSIDICVFHGNNCVGDKTTNYICTILDFSYLTNFGVAVDGIVENRNLDYELKLVVDKETIVKECGILNFIFCFML